MVQLNVLSGSKAGTCWVARRFPVRVGRSPQADFQADEAGVWDEHLVIEFSPGEGFLLHPHSEALVCLNGEPVQQAALQNGDLIELGGLKLQFWLAAVRMTGSPWREAAIWGGIIAVAVAQLALIFWLPK